jgi:hypothetical protein
MANYTQTTFFTPKDTLPITDPNKTVFGAAYDTEFGNIATAIATKYDTSTANITLAGALSAATVTASGLATVGSLTVNSVSAQQTGTFTGTLTGCTTSPTASFKWTITLGTIVTITCATGLSATSNSTTCTITGAPAGLNMTTNQEPCCAVIGNGTNTVGCGLVNSNIITLGDSPAQLGGFPSTGIKGIPATWCLVYSLV